MARPHHCIILAAGQGKRMRSRLPKVLQPLGECSLLEHVYRAARGITTGPDDAPRVTVVYGHGGEAVRQTLRHLDCAWIEQVQQLGTGHAVMQALPVLKPDEIVLILYGDVPLLGSKTLKQVIGAAQRPALAILTVAVSDPTGYGRIVRNAEGDVVRIVEHKDATPAELAIGEINTGIMAVTAEALQRWLPALGNNNAQGEYYLTDIVPMAIAENLPVLAVPAASEQEVAGINDKVQLAEVERHLQLTRAQELMRQGVTLRDPTRIDIRGDVTVGRDVEIDVNVVLEAGVVIEDDVRIGPNCVVRASTLRQGALIHANCVIEQADVGPDAEVGPYARLRPETVLETKAKVGNFVEIKKTRLGAGSKANHLAYVGDAEVGTNVNIGAGVITCNYDGANKHRTVIEDDAFIGSDCQLVAPVVVGQGATLGAGTTLTRDAPAGKLTLSRPAQKTSESWQRPVKADK